MLSFELLDKRRCYFSSAELSIVALDNGEQSFVMSLFDKLTYYF